MTYNGVSGGKQPFHSYKVNPSWVAVQPLDGETITAPDSPVRSPRPGETPTGDAETPPGPEPPRPVHIRTSLVPVTYSDSSRAVSRIHHVEPASPLTQTDQSPTVATGRGSGHESSARWDLVVHVGVGLPGAIRLERRARRFGYDKPGTDGQYARSDPVSGQRGFTGEEWDTLIDPSDPNRESDQQQQVTSKVNIDAVVKYARTHGVVSIEPSSDAGLFLCEYTLFGSIARARQAARNRGLPRNEATPVQFVHVPP